MQKAGCPEIYEAYNCEGVVETLELHEDSEGCSGIWHTKWNFVAEDGKLEFPEIRDAGSALLAGDAVIFERKHKLHQWTELASNRRLLKALESYERGEIAFGSSHYEPMTVEQEVGMIHRVADAYAHYELHEDAAQLREKAESLERRRRLGLTSVLASAKKSGMDFCKTGACEVAFKVGMEKMFEIAEGLDQDFCEKAQNKKHYENLGCCGGNQCFLFFCHMDGSSCGNFFNQKEPVHCCGDYEYNPQSLRCYKENEVCPLGMTSCSLVGPFAPAPYCSRGAGACWTKVAEFIFKVADVAVSIGGMLMTGGASTAIKTAIKTGAKALVKGLSKMAARATLKTALKQAFKSMARKLKSIIIDQFKAVAQELIMTFIVEEVSMTLAGKTAQSEGWITAEDLIGMCDPTAIYELVAFFNDIDNCKYVVPFSQDQRDEMRLQSLINSQELEPEQIAPFFGTWKGRYQSWMDYKYIKLSIDCEGTLGILGLESSTMVFDREFVLDMCRGHSEWECKTGIGRYSRRDRGNGKTLNWCQTEATHGYVYYPGSQHCYIYEVALPSGWVTDGNKEWTTCKRVPPVEDDPEYKFVVFDLWGTDWYDCGYIQGVLKLQRFRESDKSLVEGFEMVALPDGKRDPEMPCTEEDKRRRLTALGAKFTEDEMAIGEAGNIFTMTGDCDTQNNCVSSKNYPNSHGNHERCDVTINQDVTVFAGSTFEVETCCDKLLVKGNDIQSKDAVDESSLIKGDTISWQSDSSVTSSGWQLCFESTAAAAGDCIDVTVGSSSYSSKTVDVDSKYDCPNTLDKSNWDRVAAGPYANVGDTFAIVQTGSRLRLTRTDSPGSHWGLNLKFKCCSSGVLDQDRTEENFFASFVHQFGTWNQNGCDVFLTEQQCQELAITEDYVSYTTRSSSDEPRGCIVNWNGDVIFNTAGTGSKNPSWAPICEDRAPADYSTASNVNVEIMPGATHQCENYLSSAECEDFAGDMGDPVVTEFYKLDLPGGCLIDFTNSKRFLYNTVPDGSYGEGDIEVAPVCKICNGNSRDCSWVSQVSPETDGERVFVYRASVLAKGNMKSTYEEADTFCRDQGLMLASPRNHYDVNAILKQAAEMMSLMREEDIKEGVEKYKPSHYHWHFDADDEYEQNNDRFATGDYTPKILLGLTCSAESDCSQLESWKWPDGTSSTGSNFKTFKEGNAQTESHTYRTVGEYETEFVEHECKTSIRNRDKCNAGHNPYGHWMMDEEREGCDDDSKRDFRTKAENCMNDARSRISVPQREEWARLFGRGDWKFQQCAFLNWEDSEGATMIEAEICENAIYNVFACQTMIKQGLPHYEPSKCAPRNRKEPCSAQTVRKTCLQTTEDENFNLESDLDCVWCITGNCAVDQDIRCATRKFMNDIGETVSPAHKKSIVVGQKTDGTDIVEQVDSVGTYEYCKVVSEDATEKPSSAPTGLGRSVDISSRVSEDDLMEGYLALRDSDSGDWGLVCNAGVTKFVRQTSCSELGFGGTYVVDVNKEYFDPYEDYYGRRRLSRDGTSLTWWKSQKNMDGFSTQYSGDWYRINSCAGNEDSLNECSYTKTTSCSEGAFVIGCMNFEPKPGCSNYVGQVEYSYLSFSAYRDAITQKVYADGYDQGDGLIFQFVHTPDNEASKRILVYTDYQGRTLKTGETENQDGGFKSEDWKDLLKWQPLFENGQSSSATVSEFHIQCGQWSGMNILSSFSSSMLAYALALIGVFSLMYLACRKNQTDDFTLIEEHEET